MSAKYKPFDHWKGVGCQVEYIGHISANFKDSIFRGKDYVQYRQRIGNMNTLTLFLNFFNWKRMERIFLRFPSCSWTFVKSSSQAAIIKGTFRSLRFSRSYESVVYNICDIAVETFLRLIRRKKKGRNIIENVNTCAEKR